MTPVILDTDFSTDPGDLGALACACVLHRLGAINLLAVTCCTTAPKGPGAIAATLRWYGCTGVQIGALKGAAFDPGAGQASWVEAIYDGYDRAGVGLSESVTDGAALVKQILASRARPDVALVAVGPARLLAAVIADSSGVAAVANGCRVLHFAAGQFPTSPTQEWNIWADADSAAFVCANWPTRTVWNGYELGEGIISGELLHTLPDTDLLRVAYRTFNLADGYAENAGRESWDQLAVFAAATASVGFNLTRGQVNTALGENLFAQDPGGRDSYLSAKHADAIYAAQINDLMMRDRNTLGGGVSSRPTLIITQ